MIALQEKPKVDEWAKRELAIDYADGKLSDLSFNEVEARLEKVGITRDELIAAGKWYNDRTRLIQESAEAVNNETAVNDLDAELKAIARQMEELVAKSNDLRQKEREALQRVSRGVQVDRALQATAPRWIADLEDEAKPKLRASAEAERRLVAALDRQRHDAPQREKLLQRIEECKREREAISGPINAARERAGREAWPLPDR